MKSFPQVDKSNFVIMYCESNTGIVLDVQLNRCTNDNQEVYEIFSSLDSAVKHAKNIVTDNRNVECNIYDYENKIITSLDAKQLFAGGGNNVWCQLFPTDTTRMPGTVTYRPLLTKDRPYPDKE